MARGAHFKENIVDDDFERGSDGGVLPGILFTVILAIALTLFLRYFAIDSYEIPSGSMEQTIQIGNRVIGEKISYRFRDPVPGGRHGGSPKEPSRPEQIRFLFPAGSSRSRCRRRVQPVHTHKRMESE